MALLSHFYRKSRIIINPKAIFTNLDDPDSPKHYILRKIGLNNSFRSFLKPKKLFLVFIVLLLPISVSAGPVGIFLSNIFKNSSEENVLTNKNLQNMALLVAAGSPLSNTTHTPMIESDALVPSVGPSGTVLESSTHKLSSDQISIYVVREGDTLSQIAEMFNVSVNTIKWGNDLPSNNLKVGDTLVILPISGVKHTVAKGDTLASIAKKYNGDMDEIMDYNGLQKDSPLVLGSVVIIPDGELAPSSIGSYITKTGNVSGLKEYVGYYMRPIVGRRKTQGIHGYNGIDLAAPVGTPLLAAADGVVIISRFGGWNGGYGNYIVIKHSNGTQTLYAHTSKNNVSAGDVVHQGDIIGLVGNSGKSTGPHVHFEIRGARNPF